MVTPVSTSSPESILATTHFFSAADLGIALWHHTRLDDLEAVTLDDISGQFSFALIRIPKYGRYRVTFSLDNVSKTNAYASIRFTKEWICSLPRNQIVLMMSTQSRVNSMQRKLIMHCDYKLQEYDSDKDGARYTARINVIGKGTQELSRTAAVAMQRI
jgi:hypothetical protein